MIILNFDNDMGSFLYFSNIIKSCSIINSSFIVDTSVDRQKNFSLPEEISATTRITDEKISRGHQKRRISMQKRPL